MCTEFSVKYRWLNLIIYLYSYFNACLNNFYVITVYSSHMYYYISAINIRSTVITYHIKNNIHLYHSSGLLVLSMRLTCYHI